MGNSKGAGTESANKNRGRSSKIKAVKANTGLDRGAVRIGKTHAKTRAKQNLLHNLAK